MNGAEPGEGFEADDRRVDLREDQGHSTVVSRRVAEIVTAAHGGEKERWGKINPPR